MQTPSNIRSSPPSSISSSPVKPESPQHSHKVRPNPSKQINHNFQVIYLAVASQIAPSFPITLAKYHFEHLPDLCQTLYGSCSHNIKHP
jgi:hypothetical protein